MAGVRIGEVESIRFDPQDYKAAVTLRIDPQFNQIPDDSDASIQTQGLLGGKYVGIGPGGSETYLKDGSTDRVHAVRHRAREPGEQVLREHGEQEATAAVTAGIDRGPARRRKETQK